MTIEQPIGPTATEARNRDICNLVVRQGVSMKSVADMYGLSRERVRQIVRSAHPDADLKHRAKTPDWQARAERTEQIRLRGPSSTAPPVAQQYSDEDMLQRLRDEAARLGRNPTSNKWSGPPSVLTYARRFGSWTDALIAAGLRDPQARRHSGGPAPVFTNEDIVETLARFLASDRDVINPHGQYGAQHYSTWRAGDRSLPSRSLILLRFGRWGAAMDQARALYQERTEASASRGTLGGTTADRSNP